MSYYRLINLLLFLLLIAFAVNTFRSIARISQREKVIKQTEEKLKNVEDNSQQLIRKKAMVESKDYIEREARNKLNLGKEGEIVLILPSISPIVTPSPVPVDTSPTWQKWVNIFLK